jgi:hypothetical protein
VEFVVDKVALGQVFSEYFGFPCQFFIPPVSPQSSSPIIRGWYNKPVVAAVPKSPTAQIKNKITGSTNEGSEFESRLNEEFFLLHVFQTVSGVHPISYPMGTGGSFPGGKTAEA